MKAQAAMRVVGPSPRRIACPICPRCNDLLFAAMASEHVSEKHVRHVWSCDSCGHEFATSVRLSFQRAEPARIPIS
jgi:transcription elongation factor Elf1